MIPVRLPGKAKSSGRHNATRVKIDSYTFDSGAEARRYGQLAMMQRAGLISKLTVHPVFKIKLNDVEICKVELDFSYRDEGSKLMVVEDVKGRNKPDEPVSILKRKLVHAAHDIKVIIVKMPSTKRRK
jgi:hypothetical protein